VASMQTVSFSDLTVAPTGEPLTEAQREVPRLVRDRIRSGAPVTDVLDTMVALLHERCPKHAWTGVYLAEGDTLVLGPFRGPDTPHHRIRIGTEGICCWVAGNATPQVIPDVNADPRYLMCSATIRSEIVVPIARDGRVFGVIDIDSEIPAAFRNEDFELLSELAGIVAPAFPALPETPGPAAPASSPTPPSPKDRA